MQVLVDGETKRILGASLLGIEADKAIHCVIDVMNAGAPFTAISRAVHIHLTVSELIPTLLGELHPLPWRRRNDAGYFACKVATESS